MNFILLLLKNKWTWIILISIIIIVSFLLIIRSNRNLRIDNKRLSDNNAVLTNDVVNYIDALGKSTIEIREINMTKDEVEKSKNKTIDVLKNDLRANNIKLKNVERFSITQSRTIDSLKGVGRRIEYINSNGDTSDYQCFIDSEYLTGTIYVYKNDSCELDYITYDTLIDIGYRRRTPLHMFNRDFPKLKWGGFEYITKKSFANPKSKISFSETINIYKNEKKYRKAVK